MDSTIQPWPIGDFMGFGEAIIMLRYSLEKGHNASFHRHFRTLSTNMYESSSTNGASALSMRSGAYCLNLAMRPTDSAFFRALLRGCDKRMGSITIQDTALSVPNRYNLDLGKSCIDTRKKEIYSHDSSLLVGIS